MAIKRLFTGVYSSTVIKTFKRKDVISSDNHMVW